MPKYFMSDIPLAGLEHMMMDPSRKARDDSNENRQKKEDPLAERRDGKEPR